MIDARRLSILLVDPAPEIRRSVRQALAPEGFLIMEIPTVHEAMKTIRAVQFDLLIVDPFLPFALVLADNMAKVNPHQKVLFLSDYSQGTVKGFDLCPPGAEVLRKPLKVDDLRARIRSFLLSDRTWARLSAGWKNPRYQSARDEGSRKQPLDHLETA